MRAIQRYFIPIKRGAVILEMCQDAEFVAFAYRGSCLAVWAKTAGIGAIERRKLHVTVDGEQVPHTAWYLFSAMTPYGMRHLWGMPA